MSHVLITGGAGFIGSHLADRLLARGHRVRALDSLVPQVHGPGAKRPEYLARDVELIVGDVREASAIDRALEGVDVVFHLAAAVGVGQSMYQLADYTGVNNLGTAVLLEGILKRRRSIARLVVASSMSIYGEGIYRDAGERLVTVKDRSLDQLRRDQWELRGEDGRALVPLPTPEWKAPSLASIYALSKFDQERMSLLFGRAYGVPTIALRFFNVYGARQALSNPYTGVLAIFASRLLNDQRPLVYEDGLQRRDFVSVLDVAQACERAMEAPVAGGVFNVASGRSATILEIAEKVARAVGKPHLAPEITGKYRLGDVRHCFADVGLARKVLGFEPRVALDDGIGDLARWLEGQVAIDRVDAAQTELATRGLTV